MRDGTRVPEDPAADRLLRASQGTIRRILRCGVTAAAVGLLLVSCGSDDDAAPNEATTTRSSGSRPPATGEPTGSSTSSTSATSSAPTLTTPTTVHEPAATFALHRYAARMPDTWRAPVVIPYGEAEDQLGTSLGGDGEGIWWGPRYGTVAPDGTWWILDGAKSRFAQYDRTGRYLGAVTIPAAHLVDGRYVQWQYPLALADGTIVTFRLGGAGGSVLLLLRDGGFREVALDRQVGLRTDDGVLLYGFGADNELLAVDPTTGTVTEVDSFRSRAGEPYRLRREGTTLLFALPDRGVEHRWPQVAAETGAPAAGAISLASTAGGRLHLFVDGAAEDDETTGRSGYAIIDATGDLGTTEATREPWSESDDGSGSRLVARPGGDEVWFIAIDTDAVRLYQRA